MNRLQLRTTLRRRLNEADGADQWSDSDLNEALILGLQKMQLFLMRQKPSAYLSIFKTDLVSGQELYTKPPGAIHEVMVSISADGVTYKRMRKLSSYEETLDRATGSEQCYADFDERTLVLSPAPASSVSNGLRWTGVSALTMAADTDVPAIPLVVHEGIVYCAQIHLLGETSAGAKKVQDEDLRSLLETYGPTVMPAGASDGSYFSPVLGNRDF